MKKITRAKAHRVEFFAGGSKHASTGKGKARKGLSLPTVHAESHVHPGGDCCPHPTSGHVAGVCQAYDCPCY